MSLPAIHRYIGRIIHLMRREKGMRQSELALLTGLKQPNLSRIENGLVSPRPPTLEKIARALGVEVQVFYSESKVQEVERKWAASMGPKHAALLYSGSLIALPLLEISETQDLQIDNAGVILHTPQQLNLQLPSDPVLTNGDPFAIRIENDAMRQPGSHEDFRPGELAIFTGAEPQSGDFVFAALPGANLFRQVVFDGDERVRLIALNPAFPERAAARSEIRHMWRLAKHLRGY